MVERQPHKKIPLIECGRTVIIGGTTEQADMVQSLLNSDNPTTQEYLNRIDQKADHTCCVRVIGITALKDQEYLAAGYTQIVQYVGDIPYCQSFAFGPDLPQFAGTAEIIKVGDTLELTLKGNEIQSVRSVKKNK